ncbi:MAG TPA: exopolyphosphatase [Acidimicrobiales bacterium]|jgi:exopolyphosphatase/guanosine-5'-triphosphate,3'-diphosphate pyrophosphatase
MRASGVAAAVDCGTNSTRLLIVDADGEVRVRRMRITRLGKGVDATHQLDPEAMARTVAVLSEYRSLMDAEGVVRARLVATSAVRDATNGDAFLRAAADVIGTEAELLSGDEEGRLSYAGATAGLAPGGGDSVVVDIGGGSTELVMERDSDLRTVSLDLGCVRLSERYLRSDPPRPTELAEAVGEIGAELDRAVLAIPGLEALRPQSRLIGLAGTVSTLAALELGLVEYSRDQVHHAILTRDTVIRWTDTLATETIAARAVRAGMLDGRQDVIVGGALVLRQIMVRFDVAECLVSESDILDGMVASIGDGA